MFLTRGVGLLAFVMFAMVLFGFIWILLHPKPRPKLEGFHIVPMPALAMEFVETDAELHKVIGAPGDADQQRWDQIRDDLKAGLKIDYGFIALYWLLFVGIAAVLARGGGSWAVWVAAVVCLCATGAAISDVVENMRMGRVLAEIKLVADVATPGFLKWLFSFSAVALLSFTFFGRDGWVWVAGAACMLIAGFGFLGLALIRQGVRQLWPVETAFVLILVLLLPLAACAFTFRAGAFEPRPHRLEVGRKV